LLQCMFDIAQLLIVAKFQLVLYDAVNRNKVSIR
jgi:hypothetical protein